MMADAYTPTPQSKRPRNQKCFICLTDFGELRKAADETLDNICTTLALAHSKQSDALLERCRLILTTDQDEYEKYYHSNCYTHVKQKAVNILHYDDSKGKQ